MGGSGCWAGGQELLLLLSNFWLETGLNEHANTAQRSLSGTFHGTYSSAEMSVQLCGSGLAAQVPSRFNSCRATIVVAATGSRHLERRWCSIWTPPRETSGYHWDQVLGRIDGRAQLRGSLSDVFALQLGLRNNLHPTIRASKALVNNLDIYYIPNCFFQISGHPARLQNMYPQCS